MEVELHAVLNKIQEKFGRLPVRFGRFTLGDRSPDTPDLRAAWTLETDYRRKERKTSIWLSKTDSDRQALSQSL
jgi:hypothetical protein